MRGGITVLLVMQRIENMTTLLKWAIDNGCEYRNAVTNFQMITRAGTFIFFDEFWIIDIC